jgi:hypothetical protein
MGRRPQQDLALGERLADQPELVIFEISEAAVNQLGRGGRGVCGEVVFLDQEHAGSAHGRVAGDRGAVDAAADDEEVEAVHGGRHIVMLNLIQHP